MAIETVFGGATIRRPGMYTIPKIKKVTGFPLTGASIVGIVGEAVGGEPGSSAGLIEYESSQIAELVDNYGEGPIVEAARALVNPANDARVTGGVDFIRVYKTNGSTQASKTVQNMSATPSDLFTLTSANYGLDENLIYFYINEGSIDSVDGVITSDVITLPITFVAGDKLILNINGANYTYTVAGSAGAKATVAAIVSALENAAEWAPSKPVIASAGTVAGTVVLTVDPTNAALDEYDARHEYCIIKKMVGGADWTINLANKLKFAAKLLFATSGTALGTFTVASLTDISLGEFVTIDDDDSSEIYGVITDIDTVTKTIEINWGRTDLSGYTTAQNAAMYHSGAIVDLTTLAVTEGTSGPTRGNRGSRIFVFNRNTEVETMEENDCNTMLRIWYVGTGTACTMAIQDVTGTRKLTTTVTAGPGSENLDIILKNYTIQELVDYINNFASGAYTAYAVYGNKAGQTSEVLDYYDDIDIYTMPLDIKAINWELLTIVNGQSQLVTMELEDNIYGQVETIASTASEFLAGAVAGYSTNTYFQDGFDALLQQRCNIVLPLISRDATDDIADGLTDASSTYTIDSVNNMTAVHCQTASNIVNRSERNCYVSKLNDSFALCRLAAQTLDSEYASMCIQEVLRTDVNGDDVWMQPYVLAACCAGMQAAMSVGTPITYKQPNILGVRHEEFNPKTDYNQALKSGILYVEEPDAGGFRVACGNTTYQKDSNGVYNRISVLAAAHYISYNIRQQIEALYIGERLDSVETSAESIKTTIMAMMTKFKDVGLIVGDDTNDGLGYKGLSVRIADGIIYIDVTITPCIGIDFVFGTITIDTIQIAG